MNYSGYHNESLAKAIIECNLLEVQKYITSGRDVNCVLGGSTPLDIACGYNGDDVEKIKGRCAIIRMLLMVGAKCKSATFTGAFASVFTNFNQMLSLAEELCMERIKEVTGMSSTMVIDPKQLGATFTSLENWYTTDAKYPSDKFRKFRELYQAFAQVEAPKVPEEFKGINELLTKINIEITTPEQLRELKSQLAKLDATMKDVLDEPNETTVDGTQIWRNENGYHRPNDKPALVHKNNSKAWYIDGIRYKSVDANGVIIIDNKYIHDLVNGVLPKSTDVNVQSMKTFGELFTHAYAQPLPLNDAKSLLTQCEKMVAQLNTFIDEPKNTGPETYWRDQHGYLFRANDKPAVIRTNGEQQWCIGGLNYKSYANGVISVKLPYIYMLIRKHYGLN